MGSTVTTGLIYLWILMVLIIAAYRRNRGPNDPLAQRDWFEQMKDREESDRLLQQASDEADQSRRRMNAVTENYRRQRSYEQLH